MPIKIEKPKSMNIKISDCIHPLSKQPCFEADVGHVVLIRNKNNKCFEANIKSFPSSQLTEITVLQANGSLAQSVQVSAVVAPIQGE